MTSPVHKFLNKFRNHQAKKDKEAGNSLIVTLLLFPVMFAAFGTSVDLSIAVYTQSTLQSSLDTGAQSALSRALNPGQVGNTTLAPRLTRDAARSYLIQFYDLNRSNTNDNSNPFLKCQKRATGGGTYVNPTSGCGFTLKNFAFSVSGNRLTLNATVYETSHTIFIHTVGVKEVKYTIQTSARTTFATN
jgi:Flp pilus assembly protein TadG